MDPTDICPNCGAFFSSGEVHRCLPNEEAMNYQTDGDKESSPFVETHEEGSAASEGSDFQTSQDQTEKRDDAFHLRSLEINPLIREGNQLSAPNEERDASWATGGTFENAPGFLSIDTALYSDQPVAIVSQHGNPLDKLPFHPLVTRNLSDSNRRRDESELISKSGDAATAKAIPSARLDKQNIFEGTSKGDCSSSNLSQLLENSKYQHVSEEASVSSSPIAGPSRLNLSEHSGLNLIKNTSQKLFTCSECGMVFLVKDSYVEHLLMYDHPNTPEGASIPVPSSSQAGPSVRLDHSGLPETGSRISLWQQQTFLCSQCGKTFSCKSTYDNHFFVQTKRRSFECKDCTRNFALKLYLESHSPRHAAHSEDRTFVCRTCGRPFIHRTNLCRHRRSHTK